MDFSFLDFDDKLVRFYFYFFNKFCGSNFNFFGYVFGNIFKFFFVDCYGVYYNGYVIGLYFNIMVDVF